MDDNLEQKTRRNFLSKGAKWLATAVLAGYIGVIGGCSTTNDPDPPPPPTKYKHSIKVEAGKTLHYGVPVTGGGFRVTMLNDINNANDDVVYPPTSQDPAPLGTVLNLAETTKQTEPCNIILYPKVYFDNDCLAREYREIGVTNNTLKAENVILLADVDWTYLHNNVLTKKDSQGRSINTGREPRILNATSNPDPLTGLRLGPIYFEGYWQDGKEYGIKVALLQAQEWSKRYAGTAFEEAYITNVINFVDANNDIAAIPSDGDFQAYRRSNISGVTTVTYPTTGVKVMSSKEFVNQSSATPVSAYIEAFKSFNGVNISGGIDPDKLRTCLPVMSWRLKGDGEVYWIDGVVKESQKGIDNLGTTIQSFAQEYVYLEGASSYYGNIKFGAGTSIDYTPGIAHWTTDRPLRESVENPAAKDRAQRDSVRR